MAARGDDSVTPEAVTIVAWLLVDHTDSSALISQNHDVRRIAAASATAFSELNRTCLVSGIGCPVRTVSVRSSAAASSAHAVRI